MMAEFEHILVDISDGIETITLNRPDKLNAYITPMGDEVTRVIREARDDDEIRAIILTGAGRGFCAGVDLEHLKVHEAGGNAAEGNGPKLGEEDFLKKAKIIHPTRLAVSGTSKGPGLYEMLIVLSQSVVVERMRQAVEYIKNSSQ